MARAVYSAIILCDYSTIILCDFPTCLLGAHVGMIDIAKTM